MDYDCQFKDSEFGPDIHQEASLWKDVQLHKNWCLQQFRTVECKFF